MKYGRHFLAVSLIVLGALCQGAVAHAANINVVWTSEVGQFAPLWITKEARLFEKYGNQGQLIFIQGAASAAAALSRAALPPAPLRFLRLPMSRTPCPARASSM